MPSAKWRESKKAWTISLEASREQPQTFFFFSLSELKCFFFECRGSVLLFLLSLLFLSNSSIYLCELIDVVVRDVYVEAVLVLAERVELVEEAAEDCLTLLLLLRKRKRGG